MNITKDFLDKNCLVYKNSDVIKANNIYTNDLYNFINENNNLFNIILEEINFLLHDNIDRHIMFISVANSIMINTSINEKNKNLILKNDLINLFYDKINIYLIVYNNKNYEYFELKLLILLKILYKKKIITESYISKGLKKKTVYDFSIKYRKILCNMHYSVNKFYYFIYNNQNYSFQLSIHSIKKLQKINKQSNKIPKLEIESIKILDSIKVYINSDLLNIAKDEFFKLNGNITIDYIEDKINKLFVEHKNNLIKDNIHIEDINIDPWSEEYNIIKDLKKNLYEKFKINNINNLETKNFNEKFIKYYDMYKFLKFIEFTDEIKTEYYYIQHFQDFRGRIYSSSQLSPILNKYLRYIITYGYFNTDMIKNEEYNIVNTKSYTIIKDYFYILDNLILKKDTCYIKSTILLLFIELSKMEKSKLLNNNNISIHIKTFIELGYKIYCDNIISDCDFNDIIYKKKIIYHINKLLNGDDSENFIIPKDSTASVLQHLHNWLGPINKEVLSICNINGLDVWSCPYSYIINNFLSSNKNKINENCIIYFTRKYLKKTIMTFSYSVTFSKAFEYYINDIDNDFVNDNFKNLLESFKLFFKYLDDYSHNLFYENNPKDYFYNLSNELLIGDENLQLSYFIIKTIRKQKQCNNIKTTLNYMYPTEILDEVKTKNAKIPNIIHFSDSFFAKKIIYILPKLIIHDEFLTGSFKTLKTIDVANNVYSTMFDNVVIVNKFILLKENYSFFIVL